MRIQFRSADILESSCLSRQQTEKKLNRFRNRAKSLDGYDDGSVW